MTRRNKNKRTREHGPSTTSEGQSNQSCAFIVDRLTSVLEGRRPARVGGHVLITSVIYRSLVVTDLRSSSSGSKRGPNPLSRTVFASLACTASVNLLRLASTDKVCDPALISCHGSPKAAVCGVCGGDPSLTARSCADQESRTCAPTICVIERKVCVSAFQNCVFTIRLVLFMVGECVDG